MPALAAPGVMPTPRLSMGILVTLWSVFHLLEYLGTIALWSWLSDLSPARIRGAFIGRRERWMLAGQIIGMLSSGLFAYYWKEFHDRPQYWIGYAIPAVIGALLMMAAVLPLIRMPALGNGIARRGVTTWTSFLKTLEDRHFRPLLFFGCWFSLFNGVTQVPQTTYVYQVLGLQLVAMLTMQTAMRLGQGAASPSIGRLVDRIGNRPVMIVSQLLVATGPLFYLIASPAQPWWIVGAWTVWIAYVGLNVAIYNLILKISPVGEKAAYLATYFAVGGLCYGLSTIACGAFYDLIKGPSKTLSTSEYGSIFFVGWIARTCGVLFLLVLIEPGARNLGQLLARRRS
jgi:MFS family permease